MKRLCIFKFVGKEKYQSMIDNYIRSCNSQKKFHFNDKRRIWKKKNDETLKAWAQGKGVQI